MSGTGDRSAKQVRQAARAAHDAEQAARRRRAAQATEVERAVGALAPSLRPATVTTVAAGAGEDGRALVTVDLDGEPAQAAWLGLEPAVGDEVVLLFYLDEPLILGAPRGLPPTT